ncbi:MAG: FprA family A-type flavoprotein [Thermoplasmatales archaeon]|nr:FprA family A-type flavoprotein [Thermoplasmatales archaeon]MCK4995676.1 FprA family A-type flavoprotein [Thermoplasmatales archaeon]
MIKLKKVEIKPDIYWVGGIDWDIRNFHGYSTNRGTTYNAYLIIDKKITLVDTVKHYLFDEMISRIKEIIDPSKIDYIISNHVEMDHSGSLPKILEVCPNATVFTSPRGEKGLKRHYKKGWNFKVVKSGDTLNIGKRTLHFVEVPMVHWPDSMVTYIPSDKLLLPNDAFGQHIASSERFDDEIDWGILKEEAAKYYSNIVMPYGSQVEKALEALSGLGIDMIGPSHGVIWRSLIPQILKEYTKWAKYETENKALIIYDSMWGSTEKIAYALREGIEETGISVTIRNLKNTHISDVITDVNSSKLILIGSPTLNNTMLPTMGGFLTYLKGLRPKNRMGFVFGSYGWGGQAVGEIENILKDISWDMPVESVNLNYVPDEKELVEVKKTGNKLGKYLKK